MRVTARWMCASHMRTKVERAQSMSPMRQAGERMNVWLEQRPAPSVSGANAARLAGVSSPLHLSPLFCVALWARARAPPKKF